MVDIAGGYDTQAAPNADFGPIPAGEYEAEIIESSMEDISRREDKGKCLVLVWKVLNGDFANRQIWQRINLWFSGAEKTPGKVVQIANAEFATVREATGVLAPADTSELHNRPCVLRVALVADPGYEPKNEVKHAKPIGGGVQVGSAPKIAASTPGKPANASGGGGAMPWQQRKAG